MEAERITIRLQKKLMAAVKQHAKAAGLSPALWLRHLAEKATHVHADAKHGLAGADKATRQRVSAAGNEARAAVAESSTM